MRERHKLGGAIPHTDEVKRLLTKTTAPYPSMLGMKWIPNPRCRVRFLGGVRYYWECLVVRDKSGNRLTTVVAPPCQ
jgi:hypothetical protein